MTANANGARDAPRPRTCQRALIISYQAALIAQSLQIALGDAGIPAVAVCEDHDLLLDDVDTVIVCDAPAAARVAGLVGVLADERDDVRLIALDEACALDADVHMPATATTDDLVALLRGAPHDGAGGQPEQTGHRARARNIPARLTRRETQVLELLKAGATNDQMAAALGVSPNTVRTHVQNVLTKFGARSRLEVAGAAAAFAHLLSYTDAEMSRGARCGHR